MATTRTRTVHRCRSCGTAAPRWSGRCGSCGEWNTLVEEAEAPVAHARHGRAARAVLGPDERPRPVTDIDIGSWACWPSGIGELDRVLGGGLTPGSVTLLGGEPGVGKSTLLLAALARLVRAGRRCLYVSAEESPAQVRARAERLGALHPDLWLQAATSLPHVLAALDEVDPAVCVLDSIQTVFDPELGSAPGTVLQVRDCAARLVAEAKRRGIAIVLVGHVTKDGTLAGPRVLEHLVDTVCALEGERHHALRLLRAAKHRFGPTSELGLFEMTDAGLVDVPDPSGLFLADRRLGVPGSVVVPTVEGQRPLLVEVQALVVDSAVPAAPRRNAQGLDAGRLGLLLAVLTRRVGVPLGGLDVFVSAVGGARLTEPGADLAVALAVASAVSGLWLPGDLVACGEVGLGGEVRQVAQTPRRLAEAHRLGFRRAVVPASAPDGPAGLDLVRVATVADALVSLLDGTG